MEGSSAGPATVHARGLRFLHPGDGGGVREVDFTLAPGEVVALLGPNGSGKSTLLRLLAGDLLPQAGSLRVLGESVGPFASSVRRRIAFASDTPVHLDALSGRDNLRFFAALRGRGFSAQSPVLEAFGLDRDADRPVSQYSFGMRRKLLLVEAFLAEPDLLLLDEPSVGLDPEGVTALSEAVASARARGTAVVLATNEIRETPLLADRIFFLNEGRGVDGGAPGELLERFRGRTLLFVHVEGREEVGAEIAHLLSEIEGVDEVLPIEEGFEVRSLRGSAPLPAILGALLERGVSIRDLRVREPGLDDAFRALTGARLAEGEPRP